MVAFYCTMHFAMPIVCLSLKKMNCKFHLKKALGRTKVLYKMLVPTSRLLPIHNTALKCNFNSSFSKTTLILSTENVFNTKRGLQGELSSERYLIV